MLEAFALLARTEGILCAFEPAHALAWLVREAPSLQGATVLLCLSGRGDKDVAQAMDLSLGRRHLMEEQPSGPPGPAGASCSCRT